MKCDEDSDENIDVSLVGLFATHEEAVPKLDSMYKRSDFEENDISAMPRPNLEICVEGLPFCLNRMLTGIQCRPFAFHCIFYYFWSPFVFFRFVGAITPFGKQKQESEVRNSIRRRDHRLHRVKQNQNPSS